MSKQQLNSNQSMPYQSTAASKEALLQLHGQALAIVQDLKKHEVKLICILQHVDRQRVHRFCGYNSLYQYCLKALQLTENQACDYIRVARKALELPELQKDLESGELSVSKARRIIPVADQNSYREWSRLAKSMSKRELEGELAKKNPRAPVPEHYRQVAEDVIHLQAPINNRVFAKLQRAQEVLGRKYQGKVMLNELLDEALDGLLFKLDPKEKAKRQRNSGASTKKNCKLARSEEETKLEEETKPIESSNLPCSGQVSSLKTTILAKNRLAKNRQKNISQAKSRQGIPSRIKYQVLDRAKHRCQWKRANDERCNERYFLELHHRIPISRGGSHHQDNLVVLCAGHHRAYHDYHQIARQKPRSTR